MKRYCSLLLLALLCAGCSRTAVLPLQQQMAPLPTEPICRVAVLPFLNDSSFPAADILVAKVFSAQLQEAGKYLVAQDGDIYKTYRQLRIFPGDVPNLEHFRVIADRVNAQVLITGIVLEMREDRGAHGSVNPVVVMEVQIRDSRSGEVLWTTFHRRQGIEYNKTMHFGTIFTVTGLTQRMAEEILTLWFKKGLHRCNV